MLTFDYWKRHPEHKCYQCNKHVASYIQHRVFFTYLWVEDKHPLRLFNWLPMHKTCIPKFVKEHGHEIVKIAMNNNIKIEE